MITLVQSELAWSVCSRVSWLRSGCDVKGSVALAARLTETKGLVCTRKNLQALRLALACWCRGLVKICPCPGQALHSSNCYTLARL